MSERITEERLAKMEADFDVDVAVKHPAHVVHLGHVLLAEVRRLREDRDSWRRVADSYEADRLEQKAKIEEQAKEIERLKDHSDRMKKLDPYPAVLPWRTKPPGPW